MMNMEMPWYGWLLVLILSLLSYFNIKGMLDAKEAAADPSSLAYPAIEIVGSLLCIFLVFGYWYQGMSAALGQGYVAAFALAFAFGLYSIKNSMDHIGEEREAARAYAARHHTVETTQASDAETPATESAKDASTAEGEGDASETEKQETEDEPSVGAALLSEVLTTGNFLLAVALGGAVAVRLLPF